MKVHFISVHWIQFYPIILAEQERFKQEHPAFKMLCEITDALKKNAGYLIEVRESVDFILGAAGENVTGDLIYITNILRMFQEKLHNYEASYGPLEGLSPAKIAELQKALYHFARGIRQEYWLSWLQDIFCCQVNAALIHAMDGIPYNDTEQRLFIVAFPEFSFTDFLTRDLVAFYKETVYKFLYGTLPNDIPRTGAPLQTLAQLTTAFHEENREVLIFAGTIMWKALGTYYNMAPVFFQGACVYVWEKQQISGEDGKSYQVRHRHPVCFGEKATYRPPHSMYMAGSLTVNFLSQKGFREVKPVFGLTIFERAIRFAITICLDMNDHSIIGAETADIHILIAAGMNPNHEFYYANICAKRLFLYCDSAVGRTAMYRLGDKTLWLPDKNPDEWIYMNPEAVAERYRSDPASDIVTGIYIAPNIEEI